MEIGLTAIALVAIAVKLLVDVVRRYWKAGDATAINVIAFLFGYGATYVPDVGEFANWTGRANAAIGIAGISSVVAEITKMLKARQLAPLEVSNYIKVDPDL